MKQKSVRNISPSPKRTRKIYATSIRIMKSRLKEVMDEIPDNPAIVTYSHNF